MTTAEKIEIATEYDSLAVIDSPTTTEDRRMHEILRVLAADGVRVDDYLHTASVDIMVERKPITLTEHVTRTAG